MSKKDWTDSQWDSDGYFDLEATIDEREPRKDPPIPPNSPPKKIGRIDAKTICSRAVSDLIDCGSWKTQAVMQFYIDSANRKNGNCYPSEETVAKILGLRSTKAVSRADRFWKRHGIKGMPFLSVARKGRRKADGTKESNAYHVG
jgi:hypothetical protein